MAGRIARILSSCGTPRYSGISQKCDDSYQCFHEVTYHLGSNFLKRIPVSTVGQFVVEERACSSV